MLVSAKEMLEKAKAGKYAVGQFNINNLEWTKAVLLTAQELQSPVILGVSEGAGKYMTGFETVAAMVKAMHDSLGITVPVALHLDHGTYEGCYKCVKAGFTSIMFDGSHYPFEENLAKSTELVNVAHQLGLSIECEVGSIGGEEDGVIGMGECADPEECKIIADLGVDMLAAGIGNIHGKYPANWKGLSFETLDAIQQKTGTMPLVLHGGTGIPADMIKKAISLGVSKINVNTECQLSFADATRKYIEAGKDLEGKGFDPRKLLAPGFEAIKATVKEKMELFGSVGKANDYNILIGNSSRNIVCSMPVYLDAKTAYSYSLMTPIKVLYENSVAKAHMNHLWLRLGLDPADIDYKYEYEPHTRLIDLVHLKCENPEQEALDEFDLRVGSLKRA